MGLGPWRYGWDHQLCCAEVSLIHSWQPYWTTVKIHIMARTNQLSKEKRVAIITLRNEGQSVRRIAKVCPNFWPVLYTCVYIYMCVYMYMYVYIYIYEWHVKTSLYNFTVWVCSLTSRRSLCLSTEEAFDQGKSLPFINPSSLETLRALVQEIQNSGETDPEMWKDCEVREHGSLFDYFPLLLLFIFCMSQRTGCLRKHVNMPLRSW